MFPAAQPKYVQVQEHLLEQIRAGRFAPGDCLPSETVLCEQFAVSRITNRRALGELARQGHIESRSGYGHVVRAADAAPLIGLLMNHRSFGQKRSEKPFSEFAVLLMNALRSEVSRRGYRCRLYLPDPYESQTQVDYQTLLADLDRNALSGLITAGWPHDAGTDPSHVHLADTHISRRLQEQGLPTVSITSKDVAHVSTATGYFSLGYQGAEYFLQHGLTDIALLSLDHADWPTRDGFQQALADYGLTPRPEWLVGVDRHGERRGYETFIKWWAGLSKQPRALVIDDDHTGKGAMFAAVRLGLDTQQPLAMACQSLRGLDWFWPRPCVTLEIDPAAYARDTVDKFARMLADPGVEPERIAIQPTVVESPADVAPPVSELIGHRETGTAPSPANDTERLSPRRTGDKGALM